FRLCRMLVNEGKPIEAFQAIESLKGRGLADEIRFPSRDEVGKLTPGEQDRLHEFDAEIKRDQDAYAQWRRTGVSPPGQPFGRNMIFEAEKVRLQRELYLRGLGRGRLDHPSSLPFEPVKEGDLAALSGADGRKRVLVSYLVGDDGV